MNKISGYQFNKILMKMFAPVLPKNNEKRQTDRQTIFQNTALIIILTLPLLFIGLIILLSLTSALLYIPQQAIAQTTTGDFQEYQNPTYGIKIEYPTNSDKEEHFFENFSLIIFNLPQENASDIFQENLAISIERNLPQNITTLHEFINLIDIQLNSTFGSFNTTGSRSSTTLASFPAFEREFSIDRLDLKFLQLFTMNNNQMYTITYGADSDKYPRYLPTIQRMIQSFEIIK
jgi:serine/threonine-protein kinase